ncbi:MAG: lipopolysaccharide heptosyltransferase II [Sedimentisphaerales bacterium]
MPDTNILVWLPSPIGDAILCTPALRAIRQHFKSCKISFLAQPIVREVLSPSDLANEWLEQQHKNPFAIAKMLKKYKFTHAILFKNSFASALAVFLAKIPSRIGYAREGRGLLLTDKLYPPRLPNGKFKPISMIDYYLAIASWLGGDTANRKLELLIDPQCNENLKAKLPELDHAAGPIVVIVPGGAYGLSKCWPSERFAQTADWLIANYHATVVVSVSPDPAEKKIAEEICNASHHKLINLAERSISLGELKAFFGRAELVISNDTGPRHIAIALQRKVVTLFGPNDPAWTDTDYENEIQIVGNVACSPCTRPLCKKSQHWCMQAITVQMVCDAAKELLENNRKQAIVFARQNFVEISNSFFVDLNYKTALAELGLISIDAVFSFNAAKNLAKDSLARYRSRLQFQTNSPLTTLFLKRYDRPPILTQLRNWLAHRSRKSCSFLEFEQINELQAAGINTPKIVSYGQQWGSFFEKRSFIITEKIPNAESLERKLPSFFTGPATTENLKLRRDFIARLADFVKRFHQINFRHRDLYFSHIFYDDKGNFHLIDLARTFKPIILHQRFRIKDIAQLYYSAPAKYFSNTDRLRFCLAYTGRSKLTNKDKTFIRKVLNKTKRIARHDLKYGRTVPFAS